MPSVTIRPRKWITALVWLTLTMNVLTSRRSLNLYKGGNSKQDRYKGRTLLEKILNVDKVSNLRDLLENIRALKLTTSNIKQERKPKKSKSTEVEVKDSKPISAYQRFYVHTKNKYNSISKGKTSTEILYDGKTFVRGKLVNSKKNAAKVPINKFTNAQINVWKLPSKKKEEQDAFSNQIMEVPTEELANEGADLQITLKNTSLISIANTFGSLMPYFIPDNVSMNKSINQIISGMVKKLVKKRIEEAGQKTGSKSSTPKRRLIQTKDERMLLVQILKMLQTGRTLQNFHINTSIEKNNNLVHMQSNVACIMDLNCDLRELVKNQNLRTLKQKQILRTLASKTTKQEEKENPAGTKPKKSPGFFIYIYELVWKKKDKNSPKGAKEAKVGRALNVQELDRMLKLGDADHNNKTPINAEQKSPLQSIKSIYEKIKNFFINLFQDSSSKKTTTSSSQSNKTDTKKRRILEDSSKTPKSSDKPTSKTPSPKKSKDSSDKEKKKKHKNKGEVEIKGKFGFFFKVKLKMKNFFKDLFKMEKSENSKDRKLEIPMDDVKVSETKYKNVPIEIVMSSFDKDFNEILKALGDNYTTLNVETQILNYIRLLKITILQLGLKGSQLIEISTTILSKIQNSLNSTEIDSKTISKYLKDLGESWKKGINKSINPKEVWYLKELSNSVRKFDQTVLSKIPNKNPLNTRVGNLLETLQLKMLEYSKYMETKDGRDNLKSEVTSSINKIIKDSVYSDEKKNRTITVLNVLKNDMNSRLFRSFNKQNLNYILQNVIQNMIKEVDFLKDPQNPSNLLLNKDQFKKLVDKVIKVKAELKANANKNGLFLETLVLQKISSSMEMILNDMGTKDKKIDLVYMMKAIGYNLESAKMTLQNPEVKAELNSILDDKLNYAILNKLVNFSGVLRTDVYSFLTKDILIDQSLLPTRLLTQLNKSQLLKANQLNSGDVESLELIRRLLSEWHLNQNNQEYVRALFSRTLEVLQGISTEDRKLPGFVNANKDKQLQMRSEMCQRVLEGVRNNQNLESTRQLANLVQEESTD